jgi:hypothetical protein
MNRTKALYQRRTLAEIEAACARYQTQHGGRALQDALRELGAESPISVPRDKRADAIDKLSGGRRD